MSQRHPPEPRAKRGTDHLADVLYTCADQSSDDETAAQAAAEMAAEMAADTSVGSGAGHAVSDADNDVAAFLADLRALRVRAGAPTYASLARLAGLPRSTVYDGLRRTRLPTRDFMLALVHALDGDTSVWLERWTLLRNGLDAPMSATVEAGGHVPGSQDPHGQVPDGQLPGGEDPEGPERRGPGTEGADGQRSTGRHWYDTRSKWVVAVVGVLAATMVSAVTYLLDGHLPLGCQTTTFYRITAPGNLLDGAKLKVGAVSAGDLFVVRIRTTGPFASRLLGTVESTGEQGYVDQAKLDRLRVTCS